MITEEDRANSKGMSSLLPIDAPKEIAGKSPSVPVVPSCGRATVASFSSSAAEQESDADGCHVAVVDFRLSPADLSRVVAHSFQQLSKNWLQLLGRTIFETQN